MSSIFVYGPPGSGKSSLGKELANLTGFPLVDIDQEIVSNAGMPISRLMAEQGEQVFRNMESEVIAAECTRAANRPSIVALGGGALLRNENRALVEKTGEILFLEASLPTLIERIGTQDLSRPLVSGAIPEKLAALLADRTNHYESFPIRVRTDDGSTLAELAERAMRLLGFYTIKAMGRPYKVCIQAGALANLPTFLKTLSAGQNIIVVYDTNTRHHFEHTMATVLQAGGFWATTVELAAGEENKNLLAIEKLWNAFIDAGMDRRSLVVAVGGGVITDLVGFAVSTYMRGCRWVAVPTSLLAMVDAAIGGKTGFDLPQGKNLIGSFYPPELVLIDPNLLSTLPQPEYISGMAEVVKHGIIADTGLFDLCSQGLATIQQHQNQIVRRAAQVKIDVIEQDPYEKGFRAALNLGHTVGHAVEIEREFSLKHGEAISIGMVAEATLAEKMGIAPPGLAGQIAKVLAGLGLPVQLPANVNRAKLVSFMGNDKKKAGKVVNFALPAAIGQVRTGVAIEKLEEVL